MSLGDAPVYGCDCNDCRRARGLPLYGEPTDVYEQARLDAGQGPDKPYGLPVPPTVVPADMPPAHVIELAGMSPVGREPARGVDLRSFIENLERVRATGGRSITFDIDRLLQQAWTWAR